MNGYILVEGQGEPGAADNLVLRLWQEAGHWQPWAPSIRWIKPDKSPHFVAVFSEKLNMKAGRREDFPEILLPAFPPSCEFSKNLRGCLRIKTHQREGIEKGIGYIWKKGDAGALLVLRDEDDACPRERGPEMASWARALNPPFPVAIVLLRPEYEVLFLPCVKRMAGAPIIGADNQERPGLLPGARWEHDGDWERHRGVKEWISKRFPPGRIYKPALDQLPMTRMIDLPTVRAAGVPCFGTLERALAFLAASFGAGGVYPP